MEIIIHKGDPKQISPHFTASEFYSHSVNAPVSHPFYSELVEAAEFLRSHFGTAWRITSTWRTEAQERFILEKAHVPFFISQHMKGRAFDSQPANMDPAIMAELVADFIANGPIYQQLRKIGINGFGVYNTFIHLDCRIDEFKAQRKDAFGFVACWDQRLGAKKKFGGAAWITTNPTSQSAPPLFVPTSRPSSLSCSR